MTAAATSHVINDAIDKQRSTLTSSLRLTTRIAASAANAASSTTTLNSMSNCSHLLEQYMNSNISRHEIDYACFKRYEYSMLGTIIIVALLIVIGVGTTLGNTLVVLAVALVKKLQTPSNLLIVSLAASDLLVGCIVVPFAIINQVHEVWPLDKTTCDVFIVVDVLLCTSSILNLTAISVDRYFVITRPFQYAVKRTPFRMGIMIVVVWMSSALISIPPIIGWERKVKPGECGYPTDLGYQIYATVGAFYMPLIIMFVLYGRIFKLAHRMATADAKQKMSSFSSSKKDEEDDDVPDECSLLHKGRQIRFDDEDDVKHLKLNDLNSSAITSTPVNGQAKKHSDQSSSASDLMSNRTNYRPPALRERKRKQKNSNSETKAIKTLGVIMGGFTLCWLPFFIIQLILPILEVARHEKVQPPRNLMEVFLWLGYINSFMNPIIYATFNRDFRTPFKQILLCHCTSINSRLRSESYAEQYGLPMHTFNRQNRSRNNSESRASRRASSMLVTGINRKGQLVSDFVNGSDLPDHI